MRYFFIDGSHQKGNTELSGWAVLEIRGKEILNTWNGTSEIGDSVKMEMQAAIQALKQIDKNDSAIIYCDSQYIVKGATEWLSLWLKNGWVTKKKEPVQNKNLWIDILKLSKGKKVKWIWVKGHNGHFFNEMVDHVAGSYSGKENKFISGEEDKHLYLGDLFCLANPDKRYVFLQKSHNYFIVCNISNCIGEEMEVISFDSNITKLNPSEKEKKLIQEYIYNLKQKFGSFFKN